MAILTQKLIYKKKLDIVAAFKSLGSTLTEDGDSKC